VIRAESVFRRFESLELAVAAENCIESSGVGRWWRVEEARYSVES
jgi:hypothetical protein